LKKFSAMFLIAALYSSSLSSIISNGKSEKLNDLTLHISPFESRNLKVICWSWVPPSPWGLHSHSSPFWVIPSKNFWLSYVWYSIFNYIDGTLPLNIEYQTYDNQKFLLGITQKGEECECNPQGDGGTHDQHITFRFLDSKGEICSVRSSNFSDLPLEIIEDNEDEYSAAIKNIAENFFKKLSC
jgi:hypothetical protein